VKLFASEKCWEFKFRHPDVFNSYGCGPGGIGDWLVPDTIYGLSIKPACQIHDWYYRFQRGDSEEDRKKADKIFLTNMLQIVNERGNFLIKKLRRRRAKTYYKAVRWLGAAAYFSERSTKEQFKEFVTTL